MAVLELNALSTALSGSFSATIIFPDEPAMQDGAHPALYFLHDTGGDDTDIRTVKNLQALSNELGLFVICPNVMHSFGLDLEWGAKYGDFICRELPGICRHMFPLCEARQFIGGQGSGAYGAFWHAANRPEVFSKCLLINGHFSVVALCEAAAAGKPLPDTMTAANLQALFGNLTEVRGSAFDIKREDAPAPKQVYLACEETFIGRSDDDALAKRLQTPLHLCKTEEDAFEAGLRWLCAEG